jgi:uncharacterized protein
MEGGLHLRVAGSWRARLLGLALLAELPPDCGLLIPGCRSIHTCGMRFRLDVAWIGADGRVIRVDRAVPPWRLRRCRAAVAVIETAGGP